MPLKKTFFNLLSCFALLGVVAAFSGCAAEKTAFDAAKIVSSPPGAEVVDMKTGSLLGTTPLDLTWERDEFRAEYMMLQLSKQGFKPQPTTFFIHPIYASEQDALEQPQIINTQLLADD